MLKPEDTYAFLLRVAIPEVTERRSIPVAVDERRKASNVVWDCIWRAHRDVLSARGYASPRYRSESSNLESGILITLYRCIEADGQNGLGSQTLIEELCETHGGGVMAGSEVKDDTTMYGAVQKLVNMTLKYLLLLQTFGCLDEKRAGLPFPVKVREEECDCPLDSTILQSLGREFSGCRWTRITAEEYDVVQKEIAKRLGKSDSEGCIAYDFDHWPAKGDRIRACLQ